MKERMDTISRDKEMVLNVLRTYEFVKGDQIECLEFYKRGEDQRGVIARVKENQGEGPTKIVIDIKWRQPCGDQVYDAIYDVRKECSKRLVVLNKEKNECDNENPAVDEDFISSLIAYMSDAWDINQVSVHVAWNEKGAFFTVKEEGSDHDYVKEIWKLKETDIKGRYPGRKVGLLIMPEKLPIIRIEFWDFPLSWLRTASAEEKMYRAEFLMSEYEAFREFIQDALAEVKKPREEVIRKFPGPLINEKQTGDQRQQTFEKEVQ